MEKDKSKKKTLTISSSFNKKFNPSSYGRTTKKSYVIEKKKSFKTSPKTRQNWSDQKSIKERPNKKTKILQAQVSMDLL